VAEAGSEPTRAAIEAHAHDFGPALEPILLEACNGRLSNIRWFRTDWQMGGAATAYGDFRFDGEDGPREVVIKLPLGPREHRMLVGLAETDAPTPRLAAHGDEIGPYHFAWAAMERLPGVPLSADLSKNTFRAVCEAAAVFYREAERLWPVAEAPDPPDWESLLARSRAVLRDNPQVPEHQRWTNAVKQTQKELDKLLRVWRSRPINTWCHGDLHPGNCMMRASASRWGEPRCVLFDLGEVHCGHWIEDAIFLERLFWGRPDVMKGVKPVSMLAKARRDNGLETEGDYALLANARRVLMAACVPAFLHREGHPAYMEQALRLLDRLLPQFA